MPLMPTAQVVFGATGPTVLAFEEITSPVNLTATTEATADLIVTADAVVLDGSTRVEISFFTPQFQSPGGATSRFSAVVLYQSLNGAAAASISSFWGAIVTNLNGSIQSPALLQRILTPAAGSYVWSARGYVNGGTGVIQAGAGGLGNYMPAFIKVTTLP